MAQARQTEFGTSAQGVPVCRQWFPHGFLFATNIAQFGLSHYSQYLIEKPPYNLELVDDDTEQEYWEVSDRDMVVYLTSAEGISQMKFKTDVHGAGIRRNFDSELIELINEKKLYILNTFLDCRAESSITVHLMRSKEHYRIRYVFNATKILVHGNNITIGLGERQGWSRVTRDVYNDLERAIVHRDKKYLTYTPSKKSSIRSLFRIVIRGEGLIHNLTLVSSAHLEHFYDAASWLIKSQDKNGGWPIPVNRTFGTFTLTGGWYSALSQGVCMSVLARAYWLTKDVKYLYAALNATRLFSIKNEDGGIKAVFMNKYVWYEEYPTSPPSFVLNGFITALLGLYDVANIAPPPLNEHVKTLFDEGMVSLKALLPFFDSGQRTFYDLKHLTMHSEPNICRWDYHNLHVALLMYIMTIDNDIIFPKMKQRWEEYRKLKRPPHN